MLQPRLKQYFKELITLPSVTCTNPAQDMSNQKVVELLANWLSGAGFECEIMPVAPGKVNLIAVRQGRNPDIQGGLVLAGHTDTVPCDPQLWQSDPFNISVRNDRIYGLGTADMKGFFALVMEAVEKFAQTPLQAPLIIVATCDEETSMAGARALLEQQKGKGRFTLIGEPTGLKPARMHKGVMMERVLITGQAGHSSDPSLGRNALEAMTEVMTRLLGFREKLKSIQQPFFPVPHPTLNLGCIHGGDNPNRICGLCEMQFDLRPLPGMDTDHLRQQIKGLLKDIGPKYDVDFVYEPASAGCPPTETPADSPFVKKLESITGHKAGAVSFGTEAPYFNGMGSHTVILGPGNIEQAHQPDEYVSIEAANTMVIWLQQLIHHYCVQGNAAFTD